MKWLRLTSGRLLMLYIIFTMVFFYIVALNQRSRDVWILDGIVVPTLIFIFLSLVAETFIQGNKKLAVLATFFLIAMNLIPGLKYPLFYACYDTPGHYRFTNQIVSLGHVPEGEFYSETYGDNPSMHVFMACFSIISGICVNDIFRFIIPMLLSLIPLVTYFITKTILDDTTQRYVIIASSFPVVLGYLVYGTHLALLPFFLLIGVFLRYVFTKRGKKRFFLIFVILSFALITSHAVTSFFVSIFWVEIALILSSLRTVGKKLPHSFSVSRFIAPFLLFTVLLWTWWTTVSRFNLEMFADLAKGFLTAESSVTPIPTRLYEIPLLAQLQILAVFHLSDAIVGILSLSGLLLFLKKVRRKELSYKTQTFFLYSSALLGAITLFLSIQFVSSFGVLQYSRFVAYSMPICAPLVGLALKRLDKVLRSVFVLRIRNLAFASLLFIIVSSSLIDFFSCQPLVPKSSTLSTDLPENEYVIDLLSVNTVYQLKMISFAETHSSKGRIASDSVTRYQIYGFSSPSFFSRHMYHSPLIPNPGQNLQWDLFLLHTVKAGPLIEPAEYRTNEKIENIRLKAGNIIYDNGLSFIICHSPYN